MVSGGSTSLHTLRLLPKWTGSLNIGPTPMVTTWLPIATNASMTPTPDLEEFLIFSYISPIHVQPLCPNLFWLLIVPWMFSLLIVSLPSFIFFVYLQCTHFFQPFIYHNLDSQLLPWILLLIWRRKWQATPAFLPGKSHGQRTLVSYSPWGHKRVGHDLTTKQQQQFSMYTLPSFLLARPPLLIPCTLGCKLCESMKHLSLILFVCFALGN